MKVISTHFYIVLAGSSNIKIIQKIFNLPVKYDILFLQQHKYWPVPSKESIKVLVDFQVIPTTSRDAFELHCSKRRNFVGYSDLAVEENHVSAAMYHEDPHEDKPIVDLTYEYTGDGKFS